ncbi:ABC transporter substrate-binding protein [Methylocucumis oryzae]|uniref:Leucine-binding protein domain-containing protein n=1 Tax=Methylocucumis oryzae TaxID=1632867 RepID=A0A0F3IGZ6_9GAMM|nr:ABC transporter substrate-binding protein [Methylocucumis oryzae]KJV06036.1 hypothetical protein VZ94_13965 [Methylocucumis oryzae]
MHKKYRSPVLVFVLLTLVAGKCAFDYYYAYDNVLQRRSTLAKQLNPTIHVAAVWDLDHETSFIDGANLAINEVNQQGIPLNSEGKSATGRLILHVFDDGDDEHPEEIWVRVSKQEELVAVLGHSSSNTAIPASISYQYTGLLFISTIASDSALTAPGFSFTFSINPTNRTYADQLIAFARQHDWSKLLVLYERDAYGLDFYTTFLDGISDDFEIVASRSFYATQEDIDNGNFSSKAEMVYELMHNDFDAVILGGRGQVASQMIEQLRTMGVNQPILAGEGLDNTAVWNMSHRTANNLYVASIYDAEAVDTQAFKTAFQQTYGYEPGYFAYQGYQAIQVLASAYRETKSTEPIRVAATMQYGFKNSYQNYQFDRKSLIKNKKIAIKQMINGKFKTLTTE